MNKFPRIESVFLEKARVERLSQIREILFGAQDGIIGPLAVIATVAAAHSSNTLILVAGLSGALSGALAMGTGTYLSSNAERQVYNAEIKKERGRIQRDPEREKEELVLLFKREGLTQDNADKIVTILQTSEKAFITAQVQKELGIEPEPAGFPLHDAIATALAALVFSVIPLAPFLFLRGTQALVLSLTVSFIALFIIGAVKGVIATVNVWTSGLQVMVIGALAGGGGYLLGDFIPHLLNSR